MALLIIPYEKYLATCEIHKRFLIGDWRVDFAGTQSHGQDQQVGDLLAAYPEESSDRLRRR